MNYDKLYAQLRIDEGIRYSRYRDTVDKWTIGVGHNITDDKNYPYNEAEEPLTQSQVNLLLAKDVARAVADLDQNVNWWRAMNDPRQRVLANMCFQLGWPRLSKFSNTLNAMHFGKYEDAADGMMHSLWAVQTPNRAKRLAAIMRAGNE